MNVKELKQYNKFMYKIMEIFNLQDNQVDCLIDSNKMTFTAFKTKEQEAKDVIFSFQLGTTSVSSLTVFTRKVTEEKKKYSWSSPKVTDTCVFSYSQEFGQSFHDKDNICYEFNKSSHFNLALDNNMLISFNKYRDLVGEFKKMKMNISLAIYGY